MKKLLSKILLTLKLSLWTLFLPRTSLAVENMSSCLFEDLEIVEQVNKEINDHLPFFYNASFVGGYFNMPSARMAKMGTAAIGGGVVPPYDIYGANFQPFEHIELAANYRVYRGMIENNIGADGFGDDADRIGNIKIAFLLPEDGFPSLPSFAIGADDFFGSKRFNAQYFVATKQWIDWNIECTLGWGRKRIKGLFGGVAWTPFRQTGIPLLKDMTLIAEYDAIDYKHNFHEHPYGRKLKTRINGGISYLFKDTVQLTVNSVRGEKIAATGSIRYPIGTSEGLFPKVKDPLPYQTPVDTESLGVTRPENAFAQELAYAFGEQGLDLYKASLLVDECNEKELWLKVVNNRYREEKEVKKRLEHVLAALTPSNIARVIVVVDADGIPSQSYVFRTEDLYRYRCGVIGGFELDTLAPMKEPCCFPGMYEAALLYKRKKEIWTFTIRPRLLTYFGGATGKVKYDLGMIVSPEGYLFDEVYYKLQVGYSALASTQNLSSIDKLNPSHLFNVRTDTIKYFQTNTVSFEQAYLQKSFALPRGWFYRLATGYFEPAYAGGATELLYYPVNSNWGIGADFACVLKRQYHGFGFMHKVRIDEGHIPEYRKFTGIQYFLDLYYEFKPLSLDFKFSAGQFLAKDKGVRAQVTKYFESGFRFSLWYTWTNGHDKVNGSTYHDKGFAFSIPLDFFLRQSSRNYVGYSMSAWLRDVGAIAETGKPLHNTLYNERH